MLRKVVDCAGDGGCVASSSELDVQVDWMPPDRHCTLVDTQGGRINRRHNTSRVTFKKVSKSEAKAVCHGLRPMDEANAMAVSERNTSQI